MINFSKKSLKTGAFNNRLKKSLIEKACLALPDQLNYSYKILFDLYFQNMEKTMKVLKALFVSLFLILGLNHLNAEEIIVEDTYNAQVKVSSNDVKCSTFGKIKLKVKGLEMGGRMGQKSLKAIKKYNESCKQTKRKIRRLIEQYSGTLNAGIWYNERKIERTVWRRSYSRTGDWNDHRRGEYKYPVCEKTLIKQLKIRLPELLINDEALVVQRKEHRYLGMDYRPCKF